MDKKLIFLLIFAFACTKDKIHPKNDRVTISNANPIQFWLTGEESFNQKVECSIYPVCFCQPLHCDDTVRIQFKDNNISKYYSLVVLDHNGAILYSDDFDRHLVYTQSHVFDYAIFDLDFIPSEWDICEKIVLKIIDITTATAILETPNWSVQSGYDAWTKASVSSFSKNASAITTYGLQDYQYCFIPAGTLVPTIHIETNLDGNYGSIPQLSLILKDINDNEITNITIDLDETGIHSWYFDFGVIPTTAYKLSVYAQLPTLSGAPSGFLTVTIPTGEVLYYTNSDIKAYSDCIDISDYDTDCTELIEYSNSTNFAGLDFADESPSPPTFGLRIPAVFFDENFPQEQEDLELSDDTIITLWSKIEGKKLLDIGFMPFYMHKKLQMVLMMDSVSIDGVEYRMRDPYQITPSASKRSALRKASVLLSEKDFINRNLL